MPTPLQTSHRRAPVGCCLTLLLTLLLSACTPPLARQTPQPPPTPRLEALVTFRLSLPAPLPPGDSVYLSILDEVTGLAFNAHLHVMQAEDATHYSLILPLALGQLIQYRYVRQGAYLAQEHLSDGRAVRYRLFHVEGPAIVQDTLSRWTDTPSNGSTGRITGQVFDAATGLPIPNILVAAGGAQALTLADGSYLLEGLPPGVHNLVAYALDGAYQTYQQGARVAADSSTPASLALQPSRQVAVTFTVRLPENTPPRAAVRLAGNLYQLGNTFADLAGGVSTIATRMPILNRRSDGQYTLTLLLPVGADFRYKYTLGDGLWNAEYDEKGQIRLRQLIVPDRDTEINDTVAAWQGRAIGPIQFEVIAPSHTPQDETVSIQFNPGYGWLEPLPMWPEGSQVWQYTLFSPLQSLDRLQVRYCRQGACGRADDARTAGIAAVGLTVNITDTFQIIADRVEAWAWLPQISAPAIVPNLTIHPRPPGFVAGIALQDAYHPAWGPRLPEAISNINSLGPNTLLLRPTWSFTRQSPPLLELSPAQDMLWPDLLNTIAQGRSLGLNIAIFPAVNFPTLPQEWWQSAARDFPWWVSWFERYTAYAAHHADLASRTGAQTLILGGEWLSPALPPGQLSDGSPSGLPEDAETRWRNLLQNVRLRFNGAIAWALPYPEGLQNPPPFLDLVDQLYLLWDAPLQGNSEQEMTNAALLILDEQVWPLQQQLGKPIILAVAYPSAAGALSDCAPALDGECIPLDRFTQPNLDLTGLEVDLNAQVAAYNALLTAINERDWVSGFVSLGYDPLVALQDPSISVHGKPASGVLWFWFPALLGKR